MSSYKDGNAILNLSFALAMDVMRYCDTLEEMRKYSMARQLWRSGTAIGAMVQEAQNAESLSDFIHKMKIAGKEADETMYWIRLCKQSAGYPVIDPIMEIATGVSKLLNAIISSSKRKLNEDR
ncbi:MAG: four helix bundle protein [Chitinophagales bacterium]